MEATTREDDVCPAVVAEMEVAGAAEAEALTPTETVSSKKWNIRLRNVTMHHVVKEQELNKLTKNKFTSTRMSIL